MAPMKTPTKLERYKGAMVGVLCGDALGAPYETWTADRIAADMATRGGLVPFAYENPWKEEIPALAGKIFPAGKPTDDSDHTASLALSLIAHSGLNQADLYARLRNVVHGHVSPLWNGKAVGAGRTTRRSLRPETWDKAKAQPTNPDEYPSNGALMRSVPLALFFGDRFEIVWSVVYDMCSVTHKHPLVPDSVAQYVSALCEILDSDDGIHKSLTRVPDNIGKPHDPGKWPERGDTIFSAHVAFWAYQNAVDFRDGLTKAIGVGGDTDTYGAIAGGLLGAYYGIEGIPKEWREVLIGREIMEDLAEQLYVLSWQNASR